METPSSSLHASWCSAPTASSSLLAFCPLVSHSTSAPMLIALPVQRRGGNSLSGLSYVHTACALHLSLSTVCVYMMIVCSAHLRISRQLVCRYPSCQAYTILCAGPESGALAPSTQTLPLSSPQPRLLRSSLSTNTPPRFVKPSRHSSPTPHLLPTAPPPCRQPPTHSTSLQTLGIGCCHTLTPFHSPPPIHLASPPR